MEKTTMGVEFNAFEAFEIAEKIERNGARFYRRAAELFDDPGLAKLFQKPNVFILSKLLKNNSLPKEQKMPSIT